MKPGKFIVLEGIDGSGKSSHAKMLVTTLQQHGYDAVHTFEPTDGPIGTLLRRYLKGELQTTERAVAALFLADRLDHITGPQGLLAALQAGKTVVCDRYYYSSIAYNCASESIDWVRDLNGAAAGLLRPDVVVYLDLPVEAMEQRLEKRGFKEIYETVDYQRQVAARYRQAFAECGDHVEVVNCNRPKPVVAAEVWQKVLPYLAD